MFYFVQGYNFLVKTFPKMSAKLGFLAFDVGTPESPPNHRPIRHSVLPLTFGTKIKDRVEVKCPEAVQWRQGGETLCEIDCSLGSYLHWFRSCKKEVTIVYTNLERKKECLGSN